MTNIALHIKSHLYKIYMETSLLTRPITQSSKTFSSTIISIIYYYSTLFTVKKANRIIKSFRLNFHISCVLTSKNVFRLLNNIYKATLYKHFFFEKRKGKKMCNILRVELQKINCYDILQVNGNCKPVIYLFML